MEFLDVKSPNGPVYVLRKMEYFGLVGHKSVNYINHKLVTTLGSLQTSTYIQVTSFLLAITVLHKFVHWGRSYNNLSYRVPSNKWEVSNYGLYWEQKTFGMYVGIDNETINLSYKYGWKF